MPTSLTADVPRGGTVSFSSAEWTIPELCVWIVTRSKDAVSALPPHAKNSLELAESRCPGVYGARDEIIAKAQQGRIFVTCQGPREFYRSSVVPSKRVTLPTKFWKSAELIDTSHWMAPAARLCVAQIIADVKPTNYEDLLVDSSKAQEVWRPEEAAEPGGAADKESGAQRSIDVVTAEQAASPVPAKATEQEILSCIQQHRSALKGKGEKYGREKVLAAVAADLGLQYKAVRSIWNKFSDQRVTWDETDA